MTAFATGVDRLLNRVGHWEQARWWSRSRPGGPTRADEMYALVQRLADLGADAEHRDRREVPRIGDLSLPDQLRVMADDLMAADPPAELLAEAEAAVEAARCAL